MYFMVIMHVDRHNKNYENYKVFFWIKKPFLKKSCNPYRIRYPMPINATVNTGIVTATITLDTVSSKTKSEVSIPVLAAFLIVRHMNKK